MIIGITGYKGSGKDTAAAFMRAYIHAEILSFADPLKSGIQELFAFSNEQMYGEDKDKVDPRYGFTPRAMLQFFGTEIMQYSVPNAFPCFERNRGRNHWVKLLLDKVKNCTDNIIIPDVRFLHEALAIKEQGGVIIGVDRGIINTDQHPSETEIAKIPVAAIIHNYGTMQSLKDEVENWLMEYYYGD